MGLTTDYELKTPDIAFDPQRGNYDESLRQAQAAAVEGLQSGQATAQQQQALADALRAQMEGRGPSLAQQQLATGLERARRQVAGSIGSVRGLTPMQAAMARGRAEAQLSADTLREADMMRAREQLSAQDQLAGLLAQTRAQDIGTQAERRALFGTAAGAKQGEEGLGGQLATSQAQLDLQRQLGQADIEKQNTQNRTQALMAGIKAAGDSAAAASKIFGAGGGKVTDAGFVDGAPVKSGNSYENDTVPAMLSPGEIVLPRSVTQAEDAPEKAKEFVEAIKEKTKKKPKSFADVLMRLREIEERMAALEGDE